VLTEANPFAKPSPLPLEYPDFAVIDFEHLGPALTTGMAEQREEVEAIAAAPWPPTFADTIEAFERSGQLLERAGAVFWAFIAGQSTPALRELEKEFMPRYAAHRDAICLDPRLYARIADLVARQDELGLDPEAQRLLERYHRDFVRAGAELDEASQGRVREINERVSTLSTAFGTALHEGTQAAAVHVADAARLDGLPELMIAAAREAAQAADRDGYLFPLVLPTRQPALEHLHDRALREEIFRASIGRGRNGDEYDTRAMILEITALRAERAGLFGYGSHAAYVVEDAMAGTVDAVMGILGSLAPRAAATARAEAAELAELLHADGIEGPLQPWDWQYYATRLKDRRLAVDLGALKAYFSLERVLNDGVFRAATELFGLTFAERHDLPLPHPDVRIWDVADDAGQVGIFVLDVFAREGKRGGAWMSGFVDQSQLLEHLPVITNTLNVAKPPPGTPVLLSPDEVRTLFHEFGHALHGLLSDVRYPRLSGTNVPNDFVEFPSQIYEMWAWEPETIAHYARHHETGEPLPDADREAVLAAQRFGAGYNTTETLAAMLLDQAWHALAPGEAVEDTDAFERAALERHGVRLDAVPPRYSTSYFQHIFGSAYDAQYYAYLWAEVLDADGAAWFREQGGLRRASGDAYRREVLSRGNTRDPMAAYRALTGRDPSIEPLLARLQLDAPAGSQGPPNQ
jgi:peptidyl-dipeptidase Dcp